MNSEITSYHLFVYFQLYETDDRQKLTPLCVAARNGRYRAVFILLTKYKPDIEKKCNVKFDGHIVPGATALWCAASSGQYFILISVYVYK